MIVPPREGRATDDPARDDDRVVPVFGTWGRIYAAVLLNLLAMLGLLLLFSRWPY